MNPRYASTSDAPLNRGHLERSMLPLGSQEEHPSIRDCPYHRGLSRLALATSPRHHLGQIMLESLKTPTEAGTEYWLMIKLFKSGFICPITAFMISLRATLARAAADDAAALVECAEKDSVLISDNVRTDLTHQAIVDDDTGLCVFI